MRPRAACSGAHSNTLLHSIMTLGHARHEGAALSPCCMRFCREQFDIMEREDVLKIGIQVCTKAGGYSCKHARGPGMLACLSALQPG
jgi:hypothetical protein